MVLRTPIARAALLLLLLPVTARAQQPLVGEPPPEGEGFRVTLWGLFWESADLFTLLLVAGSLIAVAVIARCAVEVRARNVLVPESEQMIRALIERKDWAELRRFTGEDDAFVSRVVGAAMSRTGERGAMRDAAELAASEQCADWFRKIEPLNVIGNLGPLLGLAGTVWGMIIAFAALGETGGRAGPADLSLGISKALFHTLLGLLLAIPCLSVFGFYRAFIDRLCNRAMVISGELVALLPDSPAKPRPKQDKPDDEKRSD